MKSGLRSVYTIHALLHYSSWPLWYNQQLLTQTCTENYTHFTYRKLYTFHIQKTAHISHLCLTSNLLTQTCTENFKQIKFSRLNRGAYKMDTQVWRSTVNALLNALGALNFPKGVAFINLIRP